MKFRFAIVPLLYALGSSAQVGGDFTYTFLKLSPAARISALGGENITITDHDLSMAAANPAALNPAMHRALQFGTVVYPSGINFGHLSYGHDFSKYGVWHFGTHYISYGKMNRTDASGNVLGSFSPAEFCWYGGGAYRFAKLFSVGANLKFIYSQLGDFNSGGFATDLAFSVHDTSKLITASIVARNIGSQFKPYRKGNFEPLPFDLQAGVSFGFKHVPFRFHINLHDLHRWNIRYNNPADAAANELFGSDSSAQKKNNNIADEIFRHFIFGLEISIKKVVRLNVAYNHQRQQELKLETKRGVPGISAGLGLHIKQFDFTYGFSPLAQGATQHHFTLQVNTAGFVKRKAKQQVPQ